MLAVGAALGGAVTMRFGRDASFIVDAISFLVSALILWQIRARFSVGAGDPAGSATGDGPAATLITYARSHPRVLALLISKGGYGMGAGTVALLSVFGREVFKAGAFGIGLLFAARGLGALLGPFAVRAISDRDETQYRLISLSVLIFGLGYMGLGLSHSLAIGCAAIFLAHLGGGAQWQTSTYGLQREVPDFIRGRVFAADWGFVTLTMSISSLVAGALADRFGPTTATISTASLSVLWALLWGAWTWRLWR
jgi:MFS family permease